MIIPRDATFDPNLMKFNRLNMLHKSSYLQGFCQFGWFFFLPPCFFSTRLEFHVWRCWMQKLAFLLRRLAILVLSVLLTATLMCVTQPPPTPLSSIFFVTSPCSAASETPRLMGELLTWIHLSTLHWPSGVKAVCVSSKHLPFGSEWIKNSSCCSGNAGIPRNTAKGRCWAPMSHQCAPVGLRKEHTLPQSYWLYFFFFKTENDRFTTGLFKQTLTLSLPTPTKQYQKCTIVLIHLLKV